MKKTIIAILIVFATLASVGATAYAIGKDDNADAENENAAITAIESQTENPEQDIISEEKETEIVNSELPMEELTEDTWVEQNRIIPDVIPEFIQGDMKVYSAEEALKEMPFCFSSLPTYRSLYYWTPTYLYHLVDREALSEWLENVAMKDRRNQAVPEEMYAVSFVKYFNISKEDFESCTEELQARFERFHNVNGDDISDEAHEIPNADIIYTFDNEIINEYYKR